MKKKEYDEFRVVHKIVLVAYRYHLLPTGLLYKVVLHAVGWVWLYI